MDFRGVGAKRWVDIADWRRMESEGCDHSHQTPPQNITQVEGKILCSIWRPGCFI